MKSTILATSLAGTLMFGTHSMAHASDKMSANQLIDRVTAEEQYRQQVSNNIKGIVESVLPDGVKAMKFDDRHSLSNGTDAPIKIGAISRGIYMPLYTSNKENEQSALYLGVGQRISTTQGLVNRIVKDKTVEVQLRYSWSF